MRLEPLYRLALDVEGGADALGRRFALVTGACEGGLTGRFRGAESGYDRDDGVVVAELHGFVDVGEAGAGLVTELRGLARPRADGRLDLVAVATHLSDDARYARLNDVVCAVEGAWDRDAGTLELEVLECVWEAVAE